MVLPGIGPNYHVEVESFKERKFREVVKQQYDFSCGSAAVATLLSYHYAHPISEQEVFNAMYALADPVKVQREGFSMLDMKNYLDSMGYQSDGFKLTLEKLDTVAKVPAITIINTNGYNHFVVIKGVRDDSVLVGDPATGSRVFDRQTFLNSWNGLVFLVRNHVEQGRLAYDMDASWAAHAHANYASLIDSKNLSQLTLTLPRSNDF
ncbi:C39 family peptidase [Aestuariicella hydrocarbonica]|uniref:C39 family peptidase n=1 Tax=Pseudomaricurvus hydrocarbonicus TaxID=1470433 RepID=A0A9E5ML81_9GAMM|nr:C39 family peptidase [Aestuariicella hydrocarbonica]